MKKPAQISRIEQNQLPTLALGENVYSNTTGNALFGRLRERNSSGRQCSI
jgi:hypothetical protein